MNLASLDAKKGCSGSGSGMGSGRALSQYPTKGEGSAVPSTGTETTSTRPSSCRRVLFILNVGRTRCAPTASRSTNSVGVSIGYGTPTSFAYGDGSDVSMRTYPFGCRIASGLNRGFHRASKSYPAYPFASVTGEIHGKIRRRLGATTSNPSGVWATYVVYKSRMRSTSLSIFSNCARVVRPFGIMCSKASFTCSFRV